MAKLFKKSALLPYSFNSSIASFVIWFKISFDFCKPYCDTYVHFFSFLSLPTGFPRIFSSPSSDKISSFI